ncbi:DUF2314 domain-containing protein [Aliishimia ponticola]|uniref:DUF2314 domain-containing protein n=1 Tax=Aliishimia ponticola TaxID=2499833 RepID=A0A4S4NH77_9RHOB|nr:DUF2314 domain-containing protein [Aliishimia ponticola]THH38017.1 DUF2314 domain-containing protein [Aliishimia ponticola]
MRKLLALIAICACLASASAITADSGNMYVYPDGHDSAMLDAIEEARGTLPKALAAASTGARSFAPSLTLKVTFEVESGAEHIWLDTIRRRGKGFSGRLANEPRYIQNARLGTVMRFDEGAIMDWSLLASDGRAFGHYSTRVLLQKLPAAQAAEYRKILTRTPTPPNW